MTKEQLGARLLREPWVEAIRLITVEHPGHVCVHVTLSYTADAAYINDQVNAIRDELPVGIVLSVEGHR